MKAEQPSMRTKRWQGWLLVGACLMLLMTGVGVAGSTPGVVMGEQYTSSLDPLDDAPYPRTYMFLHDVVASASAVCFSGSGANNDRDKLLLGRARFASLVEAQMEYGNVWKVDANGDGACTSADPYLIPWLETQSGSLGRNRWGVIAPHRQLAFVPLWYYPQACNPGDPNDCGAGPHRDDLRMQVEGSCDAQWPLRTPGGERAYWKAQLVARPLRAVNVYTNGATCSIGGQNRRYGDWYPTWLEAKIGGVTAWDGIRLDLPGNMHSYFEPRDVDQDLDANNCPDYRQDGTICRASENVNGRKYLNSIFRDGNQYIFSKIHANHPGWVIIGDDAWMPESGSTSNEDPQFQLVPSGFASKPDLTGAMAEDWTKDWGATAIADRHISWANPARLPPSFSSSWQATDFAISMKIWHDWRSVSAQSKAYVLLSKWCKDTGVECNQPYMAYREMRFSMAAASLIGAYHSYTMLNLDTSGGQKDLTPTWFDEYAVYPNNEAANTDGEKELGIGWLGMPLGEMTALDLSTYTEDDTLAVALAHSDWRSYINSHAWVRYFDHGVALLNPTANNRSVKLTGDFSRILGTNTYSQGSTLHGSYVVNNGVNLGHNPTVSMPPYEGLFLVRNSATVTEIAITASADDVQIYQGRGLACDETGANPPCNLVWQWQTSRDSTAGQMTVSADYITEANNSELSFNLPAALSGKVIESAHLRLYLDGVSDIKAAAFIDSLRALQGVDWYGSYPSPGWASSPNLADIVKKEVDDNQSVLKLYLAPVMNEQMYFRSWDYGNHSFTPILSVAYRGGGSGQTTNPTVTYQQGVNGYSGGQDTYIVTTNWETPTPHDAFPTLYLRTNNSENEVMSTLIRFDGVTLPSGAQVTNAVLSLYYQGQSVNGGAVGVHVAGPYRAWQSPQTTWVNWRSGQNWQADGAKGVEDRGLYVSERIVNYTEVGTWLNFNVSDLVQAGEYEFLLHATYRGVNKDIKIASNDYWEATKRPKLMIWYSQ